MGINWQSSSSLKVAIGKNGARCFKGTWQKANTMVMSCNKGNSYWTFNGSDAALEEVSREAMESPSLETFKA